MPLILIDGMSLVFRAYHALQRTGMKSSTGEPTFAVFAFANILTSLLDRHQPEAIAVVFDTPEPTFRHEMYDLYKAHRDAFPEDLVPQLARIKELIGLMGIATVELPRYEADDVIGTIARRESLAGHDVLCVTSDKDYFQLVNERVKILRPGKDVGEYDTLDTEKVIAKFGVHPDHVIDVLALIGDTSDNVPGVKGVGEKTAIPLIEQFGSVEGIYDHLDAIDKASLRAKLEAGRENAFLSKRLVTIDTDVPIDAVREALVRKPMQLDTIDTFCAELGFHTLRRKFKSYVADDADAGSGGEAAAAVPADAPSDVQRLADVPHLYTLVDTAEAFEAMLADIADATTLSVDLETTSLDAMRCGLVGIAIANGPGRAWYVAVTDAVDAPPDGLFTADRAPQSLPVGDVLARLKPMLENPAVGKIGQNLKYDALALRRRGIVVRPIAFDTMLASYVLDPDQRHGLDALALRWLQYEPISITALIGEKKASQISMRDVDPVRVAEYAGEDADVAYKLMEHLKPALEREGLLDFARRVEFATEEVLVTMEHNGIAIDTTSLRDLATFMRDEAARLEQAIWKEAGMEFNIASPKQLGDVLFERMMLPAPRKTKTGYSTDVTVLSELSEAFPIAGLVLEYRQVEKLRSTYVESLPRLIHPETGRVHTTYNQTVAATGRLSSTDPNLQNIPIRTELGRQIRKAFVPQHPGAVILSADYSQIELRIMAALSQDPNLMQAFATGADVHAATAAILFDVAVDAVSSDQRRIAKTVNFGIMYGQGAFGLAQMLGIPRSEGQQIIANYFEKYAGIKRFIDETIASTRERGFATTLLGRRRYFPSITSSNRGLRTAAERAAVNTPIQGTAADMMKLAMVRVHDRMEREGRKSLLMLQVHDELLVEAYEDEVDAMRTLLREEMEAALPLDGVPVVVETGIGASWYEAH